MAAGIEIAEAFIPLLQTTVSKPRKPRNRSREKREFEAVLRALPTRYTFFNPLSHRRYYSSLHLGLGSNNAAELVALSRILPHLHDHLLPSASPRLPVQIFVDSKYAINVVEGKWKARSNRTLVTQTKMALAHSAPSHRSTSSGCRATQASMKMKSPTSSPNEAQKVLPAPDPPVWPPSRLWTPPNLLNFYSFSPNMVVPMGTRDPAPSPIVLNY